MLRCPVKYRGVHTVVLPSTHAHRYYSSSSRGKDDDESGPSQPRPPRPHPLVNVHASLVSGAAKPVKFVRAHAGKGAVYNYGRRTRGVKSSETLAADADEQTRRRSEHGAPSQPILEPHTFSQPSTSFNASTWVSLGVSPPMAGRSAAGLGEGLRGRTMVRKPTALILPGQGSQYVTMSRDIYDQFASARHVWHEAEEVLTAFMQGKTPVLDAAAMGNPTRGAFEDAMRQGASLERAQHALRPGWLLDMVFSGDQLELTRAENALPAIFACTMALLTVLRNEHGVDVVQDSVRWAAGHGSGTYTALVATGALHHVDALRALRYGGLAAMRCVQDHPVLFPEGCERPDHLYDTWGFTDPNVEKGGNLVVSTHTGAFAPKGRVSWDETESRMWKGTQVSAVVVRPGRLADALREVAAVQDDIRKGEIPGIAKDEFVAVSDVTSQHQIVVAGTRVGVMYASDRLRFKMLGARAVNLPLSGPFHTSMLASAAESFRSVVRVMPLRAPSTDFPVVSSVDGNVLRDVDAIRADLGSTMDVPLHWIDTIDTMVNRGVRRFVCMGPGRARAHQLSKQLATYEREMRKPGGPDAEATLGTLDEPPSDFEVWSVSTSHGVRRPHSPRLSSLRQPCGSCRQRISSRSGHVIRGGARRSSTMVGRVGMSCVAWLVGWLAVVSLSMGTVHASSLSVKIPAHDKTCFHTWVDKQYEKVGFYFAVQDGGNFDIDYSVTSPTDKVIVEGTKASQEDFVFTANEYGQYSFCFENYVSTAEEKLIDFDITVESEPRLDLPLAKAALLSDLSTPVEESMQKLDSDLLAVERTLRYFRTRENHGFSTVEKTRRGIVRYSTFQTFMIVGMSAGQVFIVRTLFNKGSHSRNRV